jgi:hypothetical protein
VRALDDDTLRTREDIDQQADHRYQEHEEHPDDRPLHAARFGVACDPHEDRDLKDEREQDEEEEKSPAPCARRKASCVIGVAQERRGGEQAQVQKRSAYSLTYGTISRSPFMAFMMPMITRTM